MRLLVSVRAFISACGMFLAVASVFALQTAPTFVVAADDPGREQEGELRKSVVAAAGFEYLFEIARIRYGTEAQLPYGYFEMEVWPPNGKTITSITITRPNGQSASYTPYHPDPSEPAELAEEDVFLDWEVPLSEIEDFFPTGDYIIQITSSDASTYTEQFTRRPGGYPPFVNVTNPTHNQSGLSLTPTITWDDPDFYWLEIFEKETDEDVLFLRNDGLKTSHTLQSGVLSPNRHYELEIDRNDFGNTYLGSVTIIEFDTVSKAAFVDHWLLYQ